MVYIFLAEGFEEVEALTVIDYLRRAGVDIKSVSINGSCDVQGAHGVTVKSDIVFKDADFDACEMIVLPGGLPGTTYLGQCAELVAQIKNFAASGKKTAAICAAPTVFGKAGILVGKKATCYPSLEDDLTGADKVTDKVVTDGNVTTSRGPSTAVYFALELIRILKGEETKNVIKSDILLDEQI